MDHYIEGEYGDSLLNQSYRSMGIACPIFCGESLADGALTVKISPSSCIYGIQVLKYSLSPSFTDNVVFYIYTYTIPCLSAVS